ncbi:DUF1493 family protein [Oxalobacteraceae bacterium A2-2]
MLDTKFTMHFLAIEEAMNDIIDEYLSACGFSRKVIMRCAPETRLYQDLGVYGEVAEACIGLLKEKYGINLGHFVFEQYFPVEFPGTSSAERVFYWIFPFLRKWGPDSNVFYPLTLEMIDRAIRSKKWMPPAVDRPENLGGL